MVKSPAPNSVIQINRAIAALLRLVCLVGCWFLWACQPAPPSSVPLRTDPNVAARVDSFYKAGTALIQQDYERARPLVQRSFELGHANGQDSLVGMRKVKIATFAVYLGYLEEGNKMLHEVYAQARREGPHELLVNVLSELTQYHLYYGAPDSVTYYQDQSLASIDTLNAPTEYANYLRRRAEVSRVQRDLTGAVADFTKALRLYDEHGTTNLDTSATVGILTDLGLSLSYTGSFKKGLPYLLRALDYLSAGDPGYGYIAARIIPTATALGERELAETCIREVLNQPDARPDELYLANLGRLQLAYNDGQYEEAVRLATELEDLPTNDATAVFEGLHVKVKSLFHLGETTGLRQSLREMNALAEWEGQYDVYQLLKGQADVLLTGGMQIYPRLARLLELRDSISREDQYLALADMEASYRTALKDQELAENEVVIAEANADRLWWRLAALLAALSAVALLSGVLIYRRNTRRLNNLNEELAHSIQAREQANDTLNLRNQQLDKANRTLGVNKERIEVLNEELNHRVKNNLAFMSSVFQMQSRRTDSVEARELLSRMDSRIQTLNEAHKLLQHRVNGREELATVDFCENIAHTLQHFYQTGGEVLDITCNVEQLDIPSGHLIRLGLIINELISNTVKHTQAVDNRRLAVVEIKKLDPKTYRLTYSDHQKSIPDWRLREPGTRQSLGTKLIDLMVNNIDAQLQITNGQVIVVGRLGVPVG